MLTILHNREYGKLHAINKLVNICKNEKYCKGIDHPYAPFLKYGSCRFCTYKDQKQTILDIVRKHHVHVNFKKSSM